MSLKTSIAKWWARRRAAAIARTVAQPKLAQQRLLRRLLRQAVHTRFGRDHGFADIRSYEAYRAAVPVRDYEAQRMYLDDVVAGLPDVTWPGRPLYLAKTSGTTSGTKYIPISQASMPNHVKGARDALLLYIHATSNTDFLQGKMIFLQGSPILSHNEAGLAVGRLSGIAAHYVPKYLQRNRVPTYATNCIEDWEAKVQAIVHETRHTDLRLISGIPPWVRHFLEVAQRESGQLPKDLWPHLQLFIQGGVEYAPYRALIHQALGRSIDTVEVYPASEGFIAVQDQRHDDALLLMLDYGIFFEFIPLHEYGQPNATRLPLWQVQAGQQYAIILSTNAGLWAYDIGDTVRFTSTAPYRIRVTGRVKHFISAFGEHVIQEEVNAALLDACQHSGAQVAEFTVAPWVAGQGQSYHEWWIEFTQPPADLVGFAANLDTALRQRNTYYDDLRSGGMLQTARIRLLRQGACNDYMASIGKLGGQNKFPRLSNNRQLADALQAFEVL